MNNPSGALKAAQIAEAIQLLLGADSTVLSVFVEQEKLVLARFSTDHRPIRAQLDALGVVFDGEYNYICL